MKGSGSIRTAAATVLVMSLFVSAAGADTDWNSEAFLYGWRYGMDGTIAAGNQTDGFPVEASVDDISGFKDLSIAAHFESKSAKAVLVADVQYLDLGSERDYDLPGGVTRAELDFTQVALEAGGGYRLSQHFDLLGVARYYMIATSASLGTNTISDRDRDWMDLFLGGRYSAASGHWRSSVRLDVGTGGSDFAWFGNVMLGYAVSERVTLGLGYRVLSVDYEAGENANYFRWDVVQDGLGVALGLGF